MTSSPNQDEMGVEVQMPPSYWDKWVPTWDGDLTDNTPDDASATVDDNDATSSGNATGITSCRMSNKKKALIALPFLALSTGGTLFALNGKQKNTTKAVGYSRVHKVDTPELCEDVRRVLVVPGSEDYQPMIEESSSNSAWHMRILNLKGSTAERRTKCVRNGTRDGDDDKCASKTKQKKKTKKVERKLGQQLGSGSQPSSSLTTATRAPEPTLCQDDSGEEDTLPELPRVEPLPDPTEPPTASRRTSAPTKQTSAPTKAIVTEATPAPSKPVVETEENEQATPVPTNQPTKATPSPTSSPTSQPTKATPSPTSSPTNQPTKATPSPTSTPTNQPTKTTPSPTQEATAKQENDPNDSNDTGFLGYTLVNNPDLNLRVNEGLTMKLIAKKNQKVEFSNGKKSDIPYHEWMDGAGVISLKEGYVYVTNSENDDGTGGVWGLYFNDKDEIVGFKKLLGGTTWNCSGGVTPWKTWISCEETSTGQCYEVDPDPKSKNHDKPMQTLLGGTNGGQFEAVAIDDRGQEPKIFITEDKWNGALRRVISSCSGFGALHGTRDGCTLETTYLRLRPNQNPPKFEWVASKSTGRSSASSHFPNSEGIAFHDGELSFVSKTKKKMFILDLDNMTYTEERTGLKFRGKGSFNGQPDQVMDDPDSNYMYFTEEDGNGVGLYARHEKDGVYYTLFEDTGARRGDETVGTATSPDGTKLYVGFQEIGELYVMERKDGGTF